MKRIWTACIFAFLFFGVSWLRYDFALASVENPNSLPIGEREALRSNAGVAAKASSANVWFNPAGLAYVEGKRFSATGSTYGIVQNTFEDENGGGVNEFETLATVPNMVVSARRFGDWTAAFSIISPLVLEVDAEIELTLGPLDAEVVLTSKTQESYIGFSAARKVGSKLSLGTSVFWQRYVEISSFVGSLSTTDDSLEGVLIEKVNQRVNNILTVLGAQYQITDDLGLGIKVQTPSIKINGETNYYNRSYVIADPSGTPTIALDERRKEAVDGNYETPTDLTFGVDYRVTDRNRILLDFGHQFPASYKPVPTVDKDRMATRNMTRYYLGYEYQKTSKLSYLAGLQWNPTAITKRTSLSEDYSPAYFAGATFGGFYREQTSDTGLGIFVLRSRSESTVFGTTSSEDSLLVYGITLSTSIRY